VRIFFKSILVFVFSVLSFTDSARAAGEDINILFTPWVVPLLGSALIDLELSVEANLSEKSSLALGLTYFRKDCNDCSPFTKSSGKGMSLYHRYYLDTISQGGWIIIGGMELARARTQSFRGNLIEHDRGNILDTEMILAQRKYINRFLYEYGAGISYRIGDVQALDSGGYENGFGPVLHLVLGYTF
jgi:hypothetical protein